MMLCFKAAFLCLSVGLTSAALTSDLSTYVVLMLPFPIITMDGMYNDMSSWEQITSIVHAHN